jgi:hypothetical protein
VAGRAHGRGLAPARVEISGAGRRGEQATGKNQRDDGTISPQRE